jgi:hypothetical protein
VPIITTIDGKECQVDRRDYDNLKKYEWRYNEQKGVYRLAERGGIKTTILMHRHIAKVRSNNWVVLHRNGKNLDCRQHNLAVLSRSDFRHYQNGNYEL